MGSTGSLRVEPRCTLHFASQAEWEARTDEAEEKRSAFWTRRDLPESAILVNGDSEELTITSRENNLIQQVTWYFSS